MLIFPLQAAAAGFTLAFQALLPDVFRNDKNNTNALSLVRLAEDLEQLASPLIAAPLLTVFRFSLLFTGTVAGFLAPSLLVPTARLLVGIKPECNAFWADVTKGVRIYMCTPRLHGLVVMEAAVAAAAAMVFVKALILVKDRLGLEGTAVALVFAGFGARSMRTALLLPRMLARLQDHPAMIGGATMMVSGVALVLLTGSLTSLIPLWAIIGFGFSFGQTPVRRIVSAQATCRVVNARCQVKYPLAGWIGIGADLNVVALILGAIGAADIAAALSLCPSMASAELVQHRRVIPHDHPHFAGTGPHSHALVIDHLQQRWRTAALSRAGRAPSRIECNATGKSLA